jgi:hypothetical protein
MNQETEDDNLPYHGGSEPNRPWHWVGSFAIQSCEAAWKSGLHGIIGSANAALSREWFEGAVEPAKLLSPIAKRKHFSPGVGLVALLSHDVRASRVADPDYDLRKLLRKWVDLDPM